MKQLFAKPAIPTVLAIAILALMAFIAMKDSKALMQRVGGDTPPTIDFTWAPAGAVDLKEMRGFLTIKDDHAIDFTTYRLTIEELSKTIDLPIPGMVGMEYESPVSFALIADDPRLIGKEKITVTIEVADDRGQKSTLSRTIDLKKK